MPDLRNATANDLLDRYDTLFPSGSVLEIRTGASPGAENAASGTLLVSITLPASPWAAASAGSKARSGIWSGTAIAAGTAGHYRLRNAADTHREDGTIGEGSGELSLNDTEINVDSPVTINSFTKTL